MRQLMAITLAGLACCGTWLAAQAPDAKALLAVTREALGGEARLSAVKTVAANGRTRMTAPNGQVEEMEFSMSIDLPDKFMKREVLMAMGPTSVYRHSGFNGDALINEIDSPPPLASGGGMMVRRLEIGPSSAGGAAPSPDEVAANRRRLLAEARQSFARLTLGMFATSFAGYPLTFTLAGQAESADGRADIVAVTDGAGFEARLFIDTTTHLPLMLTWMDREPLRVNVEDTGGGERIQIVRRGGGPGGPPAPDAASMAEQLRRAEANRRTVEFRAYYSDYRTVDGVKLPMRIARTIDGQPSDEIVFDRVRLNTRIDPKTFTPTKSDQP